MCMQIQFASYLTDLALCQNQVRRLLLSNFMNEGAVPHAAQKEKHTEETT